MTYEYRSFKTHYPTKLVNYEQGGTRNDWLEAHNISVEKHCSTLG